MVKRSGSPEPSQDASGTTTAATSEFRVGGMDCASCAVTVERALKHLEGVHYRVVGGDARRMAFTVSGMDCADEVRLIERKLGKLPGVTKLEFDIVRHRLIVEGSIATAEIQSGVKELGMAAQPEGEEAPRASFWKRRGRLLMTLVSGVALGVALVIGQLNASRDTVVGILALSTIAGGWFVVPRGLRAAMNRALDMNFLMSVAAGGAWIIGEQTEAAATLFLFAIAELLEAYSMDQARNAIKALMDLSPAEAIVIRDGQETRVPATQIEVGETVLVRPGEKIPVDGEVTGGRSSVNQAPITGESMPVDKDPGAGVFAGSLNGHGALTVRSTKPASDTTLARIIHAVEEAQASRAPSQTFVDRFARIYTPAVVLVAVLIAVFPPLVGLGDWGTWVYRGLAMLVVACPCALVISTPVSIVSGLAGAARAGILIKGGAYLEHAAAITTVCFDKTGTLTQGRPAVTDLVALDGRSESEILRLAIGVERHSEHPLAKAILDHGTARGISRPESSNFEALVGRGARARVEGTTVYVGNERLAQELGVANASATAALERFRSEGKTAVLVTTKREPLGVLAIADQVRPEARAALQSLRSAGIRRTVMLTGDNEATGRAVARELGVDEYHAELLPDDKVRIVRELEAGGERVAFVGDGVNDAPALAAATVGVAMGAAGTDVALETADIALMGDDLTKLALAIRLSRKTLQVIRQNVWFSIGIKAVFLVLAAGGWVTLWMAVAADMGASLIVVANGLRAARSGS